MGRLCLLKHEMGLKSRPTRQSASMLGLSLALYLGQRMVLGRHYWPPIAARQALKLEKVAASFCGHLGHFPGKMQAC